LICMITRLGRRSLAPVVSNFNDGRGGYKLREDLDWFWRPSLGAAVVPVPILA
jgi:hypothetical protein